MDYDLDDYDYLDEDTVQHYGLKHSKDNCVCAQCHRKIRVNEYYYKRTLDNTIFCAECRIDNKRRWEDRWSVDDSVELLTEWLDVWGDTYNSEAMSYLHLNNPTNYQNMMKMLKKHGYIVMRDASRTNLTLIYSPIVQSFVDMISDDIDDESIASRFGNNVFVISNLIYKITGIGEPVTIDESGKYCIQYGIRVKDGKEKMLEYIEMLKQHGIEQLSNSIYLGRISFDDSVYEEIMNNNRILVISFLIDSLIKMSHKVKFVEPGLFTYNNLEKTYSIITDESELEYDSGCNVDIVVFRDDICCFINDEDDMCELTDYLDLTSNDNADAIIVMIKELLNRGF